MKDLFEGLSDKQCDAVRTIDEDVEIMNIGDSVRARRIIEGTEEGRNILNVLAKHDYL